MQIFEDIAKGNMKELTDDTRDKINTILDVIERKGKGDKKNKLSFWHMFERAHACKSAVLILTWVTTNVCSYTLYLSATKLAGNVHLNFLLAALAEIPGSIILYFLLQWARR